MLIIGHRGARGGGAPENGLAGLRAGQAADADILEFDVRLTRDKIPVLIHDNFLLRTHHSLSRIHNTTYSELDDRTRDSLNPIVTLDEVLAEFGGEILLNLEFKDRGSAKRIIPIVEKYIHKKSDWELFIFSSWFVSELRAIRKLSPYPQLAIVQKFNPLNFLFINKEIDLSAIGFHRLHVNPFTLAAAKKLGLFTYAYTVNRPQAAARLSAMGLDAIVTDQPSKMRAYFDKHGI